MLNNPKVDAWNFLIGPIKNIMILLEERSVGINFIRGQPTLIMKCLLYTSRYDINGCILEKWKPFWMKQKGFLNENSFLEKFSFLACI